MFSRIESHPLGCGVPQALFGYIFSLETLVPFYSEHCALYLRGREECKRLGVMNLSTWGETHVLTKCLAFEVIGQAYSNTTEQT